MTDVKERIFEAAQNLYAKEGAAGLSMRRVAKLAGVSTMASYRHFENKEALLHRLQVHGFAIFAELQRAIPEDLDPWDRVLESSMAYARFALDHTAFFKIAFMATDELSELKTVTEDGQRIIESTFRFPVSLLRAAGVPEEQAIIEAVRAWSHLHGLVSLHLAHRLSFLEVDFETLFAAEARRDVDELRARYTTAPGRRARVARPMRTDG